ncbi:hypothetical protein FLP10_00605 [Agromyces intestinalis]|uniref:Uncharacterized protein n=1 Tax=Agromyces intestinalis TaxID=2592652 RepID=A0A5C1YE61_9MICO|nr:hypothetical protein [Agromyces intestinalis]QEO13082.1 hypothetical protein FLP10_00605 [Agromyces intestinalis]
MGWIDRIFGRKVELDTEALPAGATIGDARAVERYQRMLRTAPPDVIERAHVEAFERLTPAQLDLLFERLTADAEQSDERPVDANPANLARSVARAGRRRPAATVRSLERTPAGTDQHGWVGASLLDTVAWYAIASAAWTSWGDPGGAIGDPSGGWDFWDFGL